MAERLAEFDPERRPRQLRRRMLVLLALAGGRNPDRWVSARALLAVADDQGVPVRGEAEAVEVLDHLAEHRLIEEWRPLGTAGVAQSYAQRRFRLTDRGMDLRTHAIDPIPSIADERLGD